ncbi:metallophosphoesterase family protein [Candidatus Kuenenia stuttgartensis]|uniref:metallophosphoesterase family protein n=1 Tax=Kuenenia stuttgartiensis TaxID=174633 RepID=UPI00146E406B|nr:metallophosphoesterase family protein [Candidatus Kuenenia stuttgartiensis]
MIYAIIGDIHSNYEAFTAVADEIRKERVDEIFCVGDIVGYAAEPILCIELVQQLRCKTVAGNHDCAVVGKFPVSYFNKSAKEAAIWTSNQLSQSYKDYLKNLPLIEKWNDITLVHASLNRPEFFDYITTLADAQLSFDKLNTSVCFYGHTHVPSALFLNESSVRLDKGHVFDLNNVEKALINVGSVGQPRDWDLRASYAIYNTEQKTVHIKRSNTILSLQWKKFIRLDCLEKMHYG